MKDKTRKDIPLELNRNYPRLSEEAGWTEEVVVRKIKWDEGEPTPDAVSRCSFRGNVMVRVNKNNVTRKKTYYLEIDFSG